MVFLLSGCVIIQFCRLFQNDFLFFRCNFCFLRRNIYLEGTSLARLAVDIDKTVVLTPVERYFA